MPEDISSSSAETLDADLRAALVKAVARVRAVPEASISATWGKNGDVKIVSVEAEAVVVFVEETLGLGDLCEVADLGKNEQTSVGSLGILLQQRRQPALGVTA